MKPKTLILVTTLLMTLHGLGLFLGAEEAAKMGLPDIGADELNMGKGAYEIGAMFNFFLVAILVQALRLDTAAQRALSKGIAAGYVVLSAGVIYHIFTLIPLVPLPRGHRTHHRMGAVRRLRTKDPSPTA